MAVRRSENHITIPTGELIKDIMLNNSIPGIVVQKALDLNNEEFWNLMEGDLTLDRNMADNLGKLFGGPSSLFTNWEKSYREKLTLVNQENAALVLEGA